MWIRLDRFLSEQNIAARSETRQLVRKGRILINGELPSGSDTKLDPQVDVVWVDGQLIHYNRFLYIMLNKPLGVVSATEDTKHQTVLDLVPKELYRPGLFPAGRLDKDTEGFVLLTDDGPFAHSILSPRKHIPKTYIVCLAEALQPAVQADFAKGVTLRDGTVCLPAELSILPADGQYAYRAEVVLHEGKYHQIKRMFEACGNRVVALKRTKMGGLNLDPALASGECRLLAEEEIEQIRNTH